MVLNVFDPYYKNRDYIRNNYTEHDDSISSMMQKGAIYFMV